jgi:hypothetical protein
MKSASISSMPDDTAAVSGKSFLDTSGQSPWESLTSPVEPQPTKITPTEAYEALHVAIGYCRSKPKGYLTIKEGVLLGTLEQRLRHHYGLSGTR